MITIRKVLGTLNNADILTKYVNKETLARHVPLLALGLVVPSKSVVLEYVSQNLVHAVFLEPKLVLVFLPCKKLRFPKRKAFCMSQTFTVFQLEIYRLEVFRVVIYTLVAFLSCTLHVRLPLLLNVHSSCGLLLVMHAMAPALAFCFLTFK